MRADQIKVAAAIADRYATLKAWQAAPIDEINVKRDRHYAQTFGRAAAEELGLTAIINKAIEKEKAVLKRRAAQLGLTLEDV